MTFHFHRLLTKIAQPVLSGYERGVDNHFDHRKVFANAGARAQCKRQITKAVALGFGCGFEAIRIEFIRLRPKCRVPVYQIRRNEYVRVCGDRVPADDVGVDRAPRQQHRRR